MLIKNIYIPGEVIAQIEKIVYIRKKLKKYNNKMTRRTSIHIILKINYLSKGAFNINISRATSKNS